MPNWGPLQEPRQPAGPADLRDRLRQPRAKVPRAESVRAFGCVGRRGRISPRPDPRRAKSTLLDLPRVRKHSHTSFRIISTPNLGVARRPPTPPTHRPLRRPPARDHRDSMRKLSKHRPVPTTVNLDALHLQGEDEVADSELATTDAPVVESPTPAMRDPVSQVATPQGSATCLHSGGVGRPTNEALDQASFCADPCSRIRGPTIQSGRRGPCGRCSPTGS